MEISTSRPVKFADKIRACCVRVVVVLRKVWELVVWNLLVDDACRGAERYAGGM